MSCRTVLLSAAILAPVLSGCRQAQWVGDGISSGAGYVSRPVVSGSKKLAGATVSGTRKMASATATGSRKVADATVSGSRRLATATVSGAKTLAAGATRLVTFGSASRTPPPAPLAPAASSPGEDGPSLPPAHQFPKTGLLVTDAELGPDATRLEATAVNLAGGWILNGSDTAYRLEAGADDPAALRLKGHPATASLTASDGQTTTASARDLHYHAGNQVLTLRGGGVLASAGTRVAATGASTLIKIHLPTGAISIDGPARWGE